FLCKIGGRGVFSFDLLPHDAGAESDSVRNETDTGAHDIPMADPEAEEVFVRKQIRRHLTTISLRCDALEWYGSSDARRLALPTGEWVVGNAHGVVDHVEHVRRHRIERPRRIMHGESQFVALLGVRVEVGFHAAGV